MSENNKKIMITECFKRQFQKEQVEALYGSSIFSAIASAMMATVAYFLLISSLAEVKYPFVWVAIIYAISIVRVIDAHLY